jgi:tetratricopeptide (TPR) repeat protein
VSRTGRNDPCPCGSGKKYKQCCRGKSKDADRSRAEKAEVAASRATRKPQAFPMMMVEDELDKDSNCVIDLLDAGRIDEAEAAAHELLRKHPYVHDGLDRLGMVHEKRGNNKLAAEYYRKAAAFLEGQEGVDPEVRMWLVEKADKLDPLD